MLQSLNHDSWSKRIGIKPQIGTITDYWLHTSAEIMFIWRELGGTGTGCLFQLTYCVHVFNNYEYFALFRKPLSILGNKSNGLRHLMICKNVFFNSIF